MLSTIFVGFLDIWKREGIEDIEDIFLVNKKYVVIPHLNRLCEMVLMRGHNL